MGRKTIPNFSNASNCFLSYLEHRQVKIRELRWDTGTQVLPEKIRNDTLSTKEKDYFSAYNDLLSEYNSMVGLDLTASLEVI